MKSIVALFLAAASLPAVAQQAVVAKDSDLRSEGSNSAPVVGKVKQGTSGEVTGKNGVFVNLKAPSAAGWLFSFNVNFASVDESASSAAGLGRVRGSTQVQVRPRLASSSSGTWRNPAGVRAKLARPWESERSVVA